LSKLVAVVLVLTLAAFAVGWLLRDPGRRKPEVVDQGRGFMMAFSPIQVTVGWIVLGLVTVGILASRPQDARYQWAWAIVAALVLVPMVAQAWSRRYRLQVLGAGLRAFPPWRPRVDIRWSEVQSVEWRPRREALLVRSGTGRTIVVPAALVGMTLFESALRAKLPRAMLDEAFAQLNACLELRFGPRKPRTG